MHNSDLVRELDIVLEDMDFFTVYPDTKNELKNILSRPIGNGARIRAILSDRDVQEFLFPDWQQVKDTVIDPVDHYVDLRRRGLIIPR